jgi:tetratricopeptide (TPR) repeat protein
MRNTSIWLVLGAVLVGGCSLSPQVTVMPLHLLPSDITRPSGLADAMRRGDYRHAAELDWLVESRERPRADDLALLGKAELYCARYDRARTHLTAALDHRPGPLLRAQIEWDLAQVAYQQGEIEEALEWTNRARSGGIQIRQWYIEYLQALRGLRLYEVSGTRRAVVSFRLGKPDLPIVTVAVNHDAEVRAVVDSGAAMSIVSRSFAERARIRPLAAANGVFYGLLAEPIPVTFGLIESMSFGDLTVSNIPVAIMRDDKLRFFLREQEPFHIDLLLGTSLLREFRLRFDYSRRSMALDYLEEEDRRPVSDQNLFLVDQRPLVHVTINRQGWYPFLLDTGSEVTFLNDTKFSIRNISYGVPRYHGATMQGLGGAQKTGTRVKDVEIGLHQWAGRFEDMPLYSDERPGAVGILGQNFLQNFHVEIDFGRMRVDIHRIEGRDMRTLPKREPGTPGP